jgi:hypothetical protein
MINAYFVKINVLSQVLLKLLKEVQSLSADELKVLLDEINRQIEQERLKKPARTRSFKPKPMNGCAREVLQNRHILFCTSLT